MLKMPDRAGISHGWTSANVRGIFYVIIGCHPIRLRMNDFVKQNRTWEVAQIVYTRGKQPLRRLFHQKACRMDQWVRERHSSASAVLPVWRRSTPFDFTRATSIISFVNSATASPCIFAISTRVLRVSALNASGQVTSASTTIIFSNRGVFPYLTDRWPSLVDTTNS